MKFEYKVVDNVQENELEEALNSFGKTGWELITFRIAEKHVHMARFAKYQLFLKRPLEEE